METYGTATVPQHRVQAAVSEVFDLTPGGIISAPDLIRPVYADTAACGHFGRELPEFAWERTDRVEALRFAAGL